MRFYCLVFASFFVVFFVFRCQCHYQLCCCSYPCDCHCLCCYHQIACLSFSCCLFSLSSLLIDFAVAVPFLVVIVIQTYCHCLHDHTKLVRVVKLQMLYCSFYQICKWCLPLGGGGLTRTYFGWGYAD